VFSSIYPSAGWPTSGRLKGDRLPPGVDGDEQVVIQQRRLGSPCLSRCTDRRDCSWVGIPSDAEVPTDNRLRRPAGLPIRALELDGARDTIQLRETPGNLSGSRSETHQHLYPTGANCCYSLLLDPDATIGIDLHKRLFLLVTGREE
jgi:hypothetical protein